VSASCPRIVIAGVSSGVGKTSVTLALVSALRKRGLQVQTFKVGPDYLDPTYLSVASGRPCYNLDGWMAGTDYVARLFEEKAAQADIAVVEGVMGLFDGSDPVGTDGSTAEIARVLQAPVILVVNVHGMSGSVAALVKGYAEFDSRVTVAGVVANRSGSERHGSWLAESLRANGLPPAVAAIPRGAFPELSSRHLGLVSADSRNLTDGILDALAKAMEQHGSVDEILRLAGAKAQSGQIANAETFARLRELTPSPRTRSGVQKLDSCFPRNDEQEGRPGRPSRFVTSRGLGLGVAFDEAFHFYYPDNLEALESAGFELVYFSPLRDQVLPDQLDALYIGGGYPETHAATLSANRVMLESVRRFAGSGKPLYAECGGLMYLAQGIELLDGERHEMVGLLPQWTRMLARLRILGYVEVSLSEDSLFGKAGEQLRGHEFHYSELVGDPACNGNWSHAYSLKRRRNAEITPEGFQSGTILASYVHTHFASRPDAANRFASIAEGRDHL
jgi:cobyrinic acid a,c-diamide synthase